MSCINLDWIKINIFIHLLRPFVVIVFLFFFFSSRRRHTRLVSDWSSDVCSSDLAHPEDIRHADAVSRRGRAPASACLISSGCALRGPMKLEGASCHGRPEPAG